MSSVVEHPPSQAVDRAFDPRNVPPRSGPSWAAAGSQFDPIENRAIGASLASAQVAAIERYTGPARAAVWLTGYNDMRGGTDLAAWRTSVDRGLSVFETRGFVVLLGDCLPMTADGYAAYGPFWNHGSDTRVRAINAVLHDLAARHARVYVVTFADYEPAVDVAADLVHPNDAGHALLALAFERRAVRLATSRHALFRVH